MREKTKREVGLKEWEDRRPNSCFTHRRVCPCERIKDKPIRGLQNACGFISRYDVNSSNREEINKASKKTKSIKGVR